jgi:hypothetical protein
MVVVDLAAEELFHGVDDSPRAGDDAEQVVARIVPEREPAFAALGVLAAIGVVVEGLVGLGRGDQQSRLLGIQEAGDDQEALALILPELGVGQGMGIVRRQFGVHGQFLVRFGGSEQWYAGRSGRCSRRGGEIKKPYLAGRKSRYG